MEPWAECEISGELTCAKEKTGEANGAFSGFRSVV
jgi:hypothetical protein